MIKKIGSVIIAILVAFLVIFGFENINHYLFPFPEGMTFPDGFEEFTRNLPLHFWLLLLFGWILGSFIAGYLLRKMSKSDQINLPLITGIVITIAALANFYMIPHPIWFMVIAVPIYVPSVLLGHRFSK